MELTATNLRLQFFDYLFEEREGFLCIAHAPAKDGRKKEFKQRFFNWPTEREIMGSYVDEITKGNNVWFSVNLFRRTERKRDYAIPTRLVWADLDYCNPGEITPAPQCRIESSPKRYQAFWRLDEVVPVEQAMSYSKRIAYAYAEQGADKSGWDIEQLLRVPFTYNYKYDTGNSHVPEVTLMSALEPLLPVEVFDQVTEPTPEEQIETDEPLPNILELPEISNVIYAHQTELRRTAFNDVFSTEPASDWSGAMWNLINICLEAGMDKTETFAICLAAKCNKYDRDDRPISYLWREIIKAELKQKSLTLLLGESEPLKMPTLFDSAEPPASIIDDYKEWAVEATDAVVEYHELGCTMLLSSILSSGLYLNTSFGKVLPNLWGLILGDSTLTRKTTAMKMAMEFVGEIDREIVVATDGSVEGVLTALASRPNLVSVFYKDEVSGFIDSINRKDYLAGMPETLTQLYDVPEFFTRRLRKETITITNPVFVFFGGGIRDKMYALLNDEFILSGFLPRFLIVGGDADLTKLRPTGPLPLELGARRQGLRNTFTDLHSIYNDVSTIEIPDAGTILNVPAVTEVKLSNDAWKFFQDTEMLLAKEASASSASMVAQPTFGRLAWSTLKMGMLLGAARQKPNKNNEIKVSEGDLQAAAWYIQKWGVHTVDLIQNVGRTANQRMVSRIYEHVLRRSGCTRSELSRQYHLGKKELDLILDTLIDRGQIRVRKAGNGYVVEAIR
jgi:hypothetical protein